MIDKRNYNRRYAKEYNLARTLFYRLFLYVVVWTVSKLQYNIKIVGRENLEKGKKYLYTANHTSYLDPPFVSLAANDTVAYMAKQELFKYATALQRYVTNRIWKLGAFAVNREKPALSTIKTVKEVFKAKYSLCIFPQGGIRKNKVIENINGGFVYFVVFFL